MISKFSGIRLAQAAVAISIFVIDIVSKQASIGFDVPPLYQNDYTRVYGVHTVWCAFAAILCVDGAAAFQPAAGPNKRAISLIIDLAIGFPLLVTSSMKAYVLTYLALICQQVQLYTASRSQIEQANEACRLLYASVILGNFHVIYSFVNL
jgi:hypothetical protein